jgi:hypothetical protein
MFAPYALGGLGFFGGRVLADSIMLLCAVTQN